VTDPALLFDPPVLLMEAHDDSGVDSGEQVLDAWLRERAWNNLQVAASRTYVVCQVVYHQIAASLVGLR
jgi:hypothetical protein